MNMYYQNWHLYVPDSVGTGGGGGGRAGALCLSSLPPDSFEAYGASGSSPHEDRHKAPARPLVLPLSLQITRFGCQILSGSSGKQPITYVTAATMKSAP